MRTHPARLVVAALALGSLATATATATPARAATPVVGAAPAPVLAGPAAPAAASHALVEAALPRATRVVRQVTHGTVVRTPSRTVPWAISLWLEPRDGHGSGTGKVDFLCSGTAISAREILTAAHCTVGPGYLYVKVGADALTQPGAGGGKVHFVAVESIDHHSRYRSKQFHDDIAVLRLLEPLNLRSYAVPATASVTARVRAGRAPLSILGWGDTESTATNRYLRTSAQLLAPAAYTRRFGSSYNAHKQLAAGLPNTRTDRIAGACSGDSGGPLITRVGHTTYVVGVTDFGSKTCDAAPTVYASVGDYAAWVSAARRALPVLARTTNTALPALLALPTVTGTVALGQTLTCNPGTWSSNAQVVVGLWYRDKTMLEGTGAHTVTATDAGTTLACLGGARSRAGVQVAEATPLQVPAAATVQGYPAITGAGSYGMPEPGTTVSCGGVTGSAGATVTYDWLVSPSSDASTGQVLATGPTLLLDVPLLQRVAGSHLLCRAVAANAMGSAETDTGITVPALAPTQPYATLLIPAGPVPAGTLASCAATPTVLPPGVTVSYRWARVPAYEYGPTLSAVAVVLPGQTGPSYPLEPADLGGYLACEVTMTSWQGAASDVDSRRLYVA